MPGDMTRLDLTGMYALVTGVGGFLGRALAKHLAQAGAKVTGIDIHDFHADLSSSIEYHQADILNFNQLQGVVSRFLPKDTDNVVVFHLAAQSHVGKCQAEPLKAFSLNCTGTANLLETCRELNIRRFVFPSTALVYARPAQFPIQETDALEPNSVYAATKLACEVLIKTYSLNYGLSCRIARLGNVYGPGGTPDSVVSIILQQARNSGSISLKTLAPIRDFIYRDDVADGLIALANGIQEPGCEIFNLSSGTPISIRELAITACRVGNFEPQLTETDHRPSDAEDKLVLSIRRLSEYSQWYPVWTLEDGLRQTLSEMGVAQNG
jgi:dTDP-glucose 4,6-dehydratase